jgi:hypothetical protein
MKRRVNLNAVIGKPPARARWSEFKYFPHGEGTIDGRVEAARVKRFFKSPDVNKVSRMLVRDIETGIETMMLCAGMAPQKPVDTPWHIQYLAADQFLQDFNAERILLTDDTLMRFNSIVLAEQRVERALNAWEGGPEAVTAERIAALIEAPETPRVVRELLKLACGSIDIFAVELPGGNVDPDFEFPHPEDITPALIRRKLPAMLRKIGDWRLTDWQGKELEAPDEKGGGV